MTEILAALGGLLVGVGVNAWVWHRAVLAGFQLGRDDRALDPGEHVGRLPVGESSGRHARTAMPLVEGMSVDGPGPEVRA